MIASLIPLALDLASSFVPDLVSTITGTDKKQAEKIAQKVVQVAKDVTGLEEIETTEQLKHAQQILKSDFQLQTELRMQLSEERIETARIAADDRASARQREIAIKDKIPAVLAILTLFSFFGYIGAVTFLPEHMMVSEGFLNLAVGWLGGTASTVVAYYFGSSAGQDKAQALNKK
tara:strand:- start:623 stop:1150 length:528 start_codon:yes stop_codon:yes gene_type:complete